MAAGPERTPPDGELVARAARGDEAAFAAWATRHRDALTRTAAGLLGAGEDAEDVVQETLLRAYRAIAAGKRPENPRAWLYAILRNCCADHRRTRTFTDALPEEARSDSDTVARFEQRERLEGVLRAIGELPPHQRDLFVDREFNGRSYADLARRHHLSLSAVKSSLLRARRNLAASRAGQLLLTPLATLSHRAAALAPADGDAAVPKVAAGGLGLLAKVLTTTAITGGLVLGLPESRPGTGSASGGVPPAAIHREVAAVPTLPHPDASSDRHRAAARPAILTPAAQARAARRAVAACATGDLARGRYPVAALRQARRELPVDVGEYTDCDAALQGAILAAVSRG